MSKAQYEFIGVDEAMPPENAMVCALDDEGGQWCAYVYNDGCWSADDFSHEGQNLHDIVAWRAYRDNEVRGRSSHPYYIIKESSCQ